MFGKKYKKEFDEACEQVLALDGDERTVCSELCFIGCRLIVFYSIAFLVSCLSLTVKLVITFLSF